jgi:hypothetical protein
VRIASCQADRRLAGEGVRTPRGWT